MSKHEHKHTINNVVKEQNSTNNNNNICYNEARNDKNNATVSKSVDCAKSHINDGTASDGESWHILDAEEESLGQVGGNLVRPGLPPKDFIEICPVVNPSQKPSPELVKLCVTLYALLPIAGFIATHLLLVLLFTRYWYVTLMYVVYLLWDKQSCNRGGRRSTRVYNSRFWTNLATYFPIKLRYSRDFQLDPNENYILNYHPHGIAAFGVVTSFATNGLGFTNLFPNIRARFMVHETSFMIPILREVFTLRGDCSVNSKSFDYLLTKSRGNLLTLICGGLAEADMSKPDRLEIVIKKRKGFVKKAMIHGANIIPCIGFGENSVFTKVNFAPSSFMHRLEEKWYQLFKFKHPIYYGESLLSKGRKGFMPYKRPITVVMGNPILIEKNENPSQEQIDSIHGTYLRSLQKLFDANRDLCLDNDKTLVML